MKFKRLKLLACGLCCTSAVAVAQPPYDQCPMGTMLQTITQPNGYPSPGCVPLQQPFVAQPYYGVVAPPVYINPTYPGYYGGYGYGYGYYGRGWEHHRR